MHTRSELAPPVTGRCRVASSPSRDLTLGLGREASSPLGKGRLVACAAFRVRLVAYCLVSSALFWLVCKMRIARALGRSVSLALACELLHTPTKTLSIFHAQLESRRHKYAGRSARK
jgi:hypothetical protein